MGRVMLDALEAWLQQRWRARRVDLSDLAPMSGGAIQENWRFDARVEGGPMSGSHGLVVRLDAPSGLLISHGRAHEFRVLSAAHHAGVRVPEPLALCDDSAVLGRPFFVMRRVNGSTDPRTLTASGPHPDLVRALGGELARLHAIEPPRSDLGFLGPPPADPARDLVRRLQTMLDGADAPHPALEWGLAWLARNAPPPVPPVLCHRDFRTGNLLVANGELRAVLDWEFAGWSDPAEDLGWMTASCWRFRRPEHEAGGLGAAADLFAGYAAAGGSLPSVGRVRYWQGMALARWAVIALGQAMRHRSGAEPNLELALTGHMVPELELALLDHAQPG